MQPPASFTSERLGEGTFNIGPEGLADRGAEIAAAVIEDIGDALKTFVRTLTTPGAKVPYTLSVAVVLVKDEADTYNAVLPEDGTALFATEVRLRMEPFALPESSS